MMNDIDSQRSGYPHELSTKTKKFKLFEKRRLTHEKAKAFCKKREGQLAQGDILLFRYRKTSNKRPRQFLK